MFGDHNEVYAFILFNFSAKLSNRSRNGWVNACDSFERHFMMSFLNIKFVKPRQRTLANTNLLKLTLNLEYKG